MAHTFRDFCSRYLRLTAISWILGGSLWSAGGALALTRAELYQATAPLADRSDGAQAAAFQTALRSVMVRVTGRRNAGEDPVFAPLYGNSRRYVQQYRAAADGQVWVAFDGAAIERWLTQNGQPVWGSERPLTLVCVAVSAGSAGGGFLTAEDTSELKSTIDAGAVARGIPLIWPSAADLQRSHLDPESVTGAIPAGVAELSRRLGAEAVLVGRASNATASAAVRWTHQFQDRSSELSGAVEGVNRAADTYAALFAASGTLVPLDIEVNGIADLKAYASVQAYLESLTFISHVSVQGLSGDMARYRLSARGGAESLQHTLALGGRLQPLAAADNGIQRFQYRR